MKITSFEEFRELAQRGTFVPVCKEIVADLLTPVSAFLKIAEDADYAFLLESVEGGEHVGRYSFLGKDPFLILRSRDGYLFAGLRECDEIIGLAVDAASGKLSQTGRWPSGGGTPRDFVLSPNGRHLVVTNQDSDRVTVFPVNSGTLGAPLQNLNVGTPMAIAIADL